MYWKRKTICLPLDMTNKWLSNTIKVMSAYISKVWIHTMSLILTRLCCTFLQQVLLPHHIRLKSCGLTFCQWLTAECIWTSTTVTPAVQSQFPISTWHSVLQWVDYCASTTKHTVSSSTHSWGKTTHRARKKLWIKVATKWQIHPAAVYTASQQHPV